MTNSEDSLSSRFSTSVESATWHHYLELTKPRLSAMSVITAMVGYTVVVPLFEWTRMLLVMVGTALCAGGVAALNQWMESDADAKMRRTAGRPIPAGIIQPGSAFVLGWMLCLTGLALLFVKVNGLSAFLALATIVAYLAIYTPAKQWSRWNTEIGAISGALPPMIGWAAAGSSSPLLGWTLFFILYTWQMPHFLALSWAYQKDYAAAGMKMISVLDLSGMRVARRAFVWTMLLVAGSCLPTILGYCSWYYLAFSSVFGFWFLRSAFFFLNPDKREAEARRLFLVSIYYLPLQLGLLLADRLWLHY